MSIFILEINNPDAEHIPVIASFAIPFILTSFAAEYNNKDVFNAVLMFSVGSCFFVCFIRAGLIPAVPLPASVPDRTHSAKH